VLPLQISWAATVVYCNHEESSVTQHFGHHVHKHEKDIPSKTTQVHSDCGYCNLATQVLIINEAFTFELPELSKHTDFLIPSYSSHVPDGPRDPDRLIVA
jgi:hypothetical protein